MPKPNCRHLAVATAVLTLVTSSTDAVACGGGVVSAEATEIAADTQRIFLSFRDGKTDVVTQIVVPETTANYGVLLPVASEPTLDPEPVDSVDIDAIDRVTAPGVYVDRGDGDDGGGCGCPVMGADSPKSGGGGDGSSLRVTSVTEIGPVTATVLTGDTGATVNGWLTDNGFALDADDQELVSDYSGTGRYFIAIRRSENALPGDATSIGVHFTLPGDQRGLPLRFAKIGAADAVAFTLFIAASETSAPASPFSALTLDDLDATTLRSGDYATAVADAVLANGNRAFVIEGVHPAPDVRRSALGLADLMDATQVVTRLSTVLPRASLSADVALNASFAGDAPSERHVRTSPTRDTLRYAGVFALACTVVGRRRVGRRTH